MSVRAVRNQGADRSAQLEEYGAQCEWTRSARRMARRGQ
jgi:hypothetical protein